VVTGGSDGIGFAMAKKLATQGFNICIIARNKEKIDQKLVEIKNECRNGDDSFKTMALIADFGSMYTIADYQTKIGD